MLRMIDTYENIFTRAKFDSETFPDIIIGKDAWTYIRQNNECCKS